MNEIRNRVRELRHLRASTLIRNPKNFRVHSLAQRSMIRGLLEEIGYAGALIARDTPAGVELLDGEMRSDETPDTEVPVLIVDLDDDEAEKFLATHDPVGALASQNDEKMRALLGRIQTDNANVRQLLADIRPDEPDEDASEEPDEKDHDVPGMSLEPHEHYDYLVVLCTTTHEWNVLCDKLGMKPVNRRGRMGTSRAIRAGVLLEKFAELEGELLRLQLRQDPNPPDTEHYTDGFAAETELAALETQQPGGFAPPASVAK